MLISSLTHQEVLMPQVINGCLVLLLELLNLDRRIYSVSYGSLNLSSLSIKLLSTLLLRVLCLGGGIIFPFHEDLKVFIELLVILEPLEHIMPIYEVLGTTIDSFIQGQVLLLYQPTKLSLVKH